MSKLTRSILQLLIIFLTATIALAGDCLPATARNPEGNYIVPGVQGDIVYRRVNGVELSLDAYVQRRGKRRPAVIIIHGGGFTSGSRVAFTGQFMEMLTRAGYNWFAIDYRLGSYENALDDLRAALEFVRCHAREFRIDPDRIALLGEDAGAYLTRGLMIEQPAGVKAAVLIGGLYDPRAVGALKANAVVEADASPLPRRFPGRLTDTLIVHGTADREAPPEQALKYCESLRRAGGQCDYLPVEGAIHRPENWRPEQWGYKTKVTGWLSQKLKPAAPDHEPYSANLRKDIMFSPQHGLKLDAYIPQGRGPFPAVIIAHGGGWEAGDKVTYATPVFEPLARAGFAWFSIDYRLTPQFRNQNQLEDVRTAISFVRANASRFRVDPDRLALLGESASGQMVAQLATESPRGVRAVVSFYGVYDFTAMAKDLSPRSIPVRLFRLTKLDDEARETMRRFSPLYNVSKEMPPLLLICGTKDSLFAQQTSFIQQLDKVGARYDAINIDGAPHGMENWEGHPEWMSYKQKMADWLRAQLRD
jgi:alpha-L-fucosidase 2